MNKLFYILIVMFIILLASWYRYETDTWKGWTRERIEGKYHITETFMWK